MKECYLCDIQLALMATNTVYNHFDGMTDNYIGTYKAKYKHLSDNGKASSNLVIHLLCKLSSVHV